MSTITSFLFFDALPIFRLRHLRVDARFVESARTLVLCDQDIGASRILFDNIGEGTFGGVVIARFEVLDEGKVCEGNSELVIIWLNRDLASGHLRGVSSLLGRTGRKVLQLWARN